MDVNGYFPWWLVSAGLDYGIQVYDNFKVAYSWKDAMYGKVDFAKVALSAILPTGKLKFAKTFAAEYAKASVSFLPEERLSFTSDPLDAAYTAVLFTVTDYSIGKVLDFGSDIATEAAAKRSNDAAKIAIHDLNVSKNRPLSSSRANKASVSMEGANIARKEYVLRKIVNRTINSSEAASQITQISANKAAEVFFSDYDKEKKYGIKFSAYGE